MGAFTQIPESTFQEMQTNAGVLLKTFDPTGETPMANEDIICATTGGISVSCVPTYSDMGEDVDNCPVGMLELMNLDGWETTMSFTSISVGPEVIRLALGSADIDSLDATKVTPRRTLRQTDFQTIWWVGDRADGGHVAVQMLNALSTGGFALQTTKNGKGQVSLELKGHVSIEAQDVVPMVFYSEAAAEEKTVIS